MDEDHEPRGPLVLGIGGFGALIVSSMGPEGPERLVLDTDVRTKEKYPMENVILLGEKALDGEGVGRDLKLGMMAFRSSMNDILPLVQDHFPVLMIAGCEGGTGLSGAVEIGSELRRRGIPFFNFIFTDDASAPGSNRTALALNLLSGPLYPGCLIGSGHTTEDMARAIQDLARASAPGPGIRIPLEAWTRLSSSKATYTLEHQSMGMGEISSLKEGRGPALRGACIAALRSPEHLGAMDVKGIIEALLGFSENIAVGILKSEGERITLSSLSQSIDPGPLPSMGSDPDMSEPSLMYQEMDMPQRELHQQS
ncbi:MAG: hypothetical protein QCI82_05410 [Candidatus Thermoplasmatota archaeon]|nr:hypothetical protein [Candidatus Thermoplasmatota archaeon]